MRLIIKNEEKMKNTPIIVSIEDEEDISELIGYNVKKENFAFYSFGDGESFFDFEFKYQPSILLLDVMLPGINGFEILKKVRKSDKYGEIAVIMLTAKNNEIDKILGLEVGADDYITKPFSPRELIARIKAILRRLTPIDQTNNIISYKNLTILPDQYKVMVDDKPIKLTTTEFNFLQLLISNIDKVFSREQIISKAIGEEVFITDRTVDVHITQVRKKIGIYGKNIKSVRGIGYKFEE